MDVVVLSILRELHDDANQVRERGYIGSLHDRGTVILYGALADAEDPGDILA